jgi:hypothetical protein
MNEKKLIVEIPKAADFHSAVLTTFSFDFHHFESQVLRQLKCRGIINVNLLADDEMLDQAIGISTGNLKSLSKAYTINGVSSKGAFHPKLSLLAGEKEVLLLQGSGNITNGGHGKNHELFGALYATTNDKSQLPLILEAWEYIKRLAERTGGISREKIAWTENNCTLLQERISQNHIWYPIDADLKAAMVYNDETSLWSQLRNLIAPEEIKAITVVAPFYDEAGTFLVNLANEFSRADIKVFIQEGKGIHPHRMPSHDRIAFLAWESTRRANEKVRKIADRKLHAKIMVFESGNEQYCLFGSPNATIKAFGTDGSAASNDEFASILRTKDRDFLTDLGLDGIHVKAQPQEHQSIESAEKTMEESSANRQHRAKLIGVDQDGAFLTIYLQNAKAIPSAILKVYDAWGTELEQSTVKLDKEQILHELKSYSYARQVAYVQLFGENGLEVSNKQIVNNVHEIINTNPSQENRKLLRLASIIELGNDKVFDIIDYMNTLRSAREPGIVRNAVRSGTDGRGQTNSTSLSYDEVFALKEEETDIEKALSNHNSIHIWDAIEKYFNQLAISEDEEDMDDEEEGTTSSSRTRKERVDRTAPIVLNSSKVLETRRKAVEKFFMNYQNALKNSSDLREYTIGLVDFAMFLIVMKQLIQFSERRITLKTADKEQDRVDKVFYPVKGNLSELKSFTGTTLNLLGQFANLLNRHPFQEVKDEYTSAKLKHYKTLSYRSALFVLAVTKEVYSTHTNGAKWADVIAFNIMDKFGPIEEQLETYFEEYLKNVSIEQLSVPDLMGHVHAWQRTIQAKNWSDYINIPGLGFCSIEKRIPEGENPKYLKIARPGFPYSAEDNEFYFPELYECSTGRFMKSRQSIQK